MTAAPEIVAEMAAWERYRSYVLSKMPSQVKAFGGDEASHGLWRDWKAARAERDKLSRAETSYNHRRSK